MKSKRGKEERYKKSKGEDIDNATKKREKLLAKYSASPYYRRDPGLNTSSSESNVGLGEKSVGDCQSSTIKQLPARKLSSETSKFPESDTHETSTKPSGIGLQSKSPHTQVYVVTAVKHVKPKRVSSACSTITTKISLSPKNLPFGEGTSATSNTLVSSQIGRFDRKSRQKSSAKPLQAKVDSNVEGIAIPKVKMSSTFGSTDSEKTSHLPGKISPKVFYRPSPFAILSEESPKATTTVTTKTETKIDSQELMPKLVDGKWDLFETIEKLKAIGSIVRSPKRVQLPDQSNDRGESLNVDSTNVFKKTDVSKVTLKTGAVQNQYKKTVRRIVRPKVKSTSGRLGEMALTQSVDQSSIRNKGEPITSTMETNQLESSSVSRDNHSGTVDENENKTSTTTSNPTLLGYNGNPVKRKRSGVRTIASNVITNKNKSKKSISGKKSVEIKSIDDMERMKKSSTDGLDANFAEESVSNDLENLSCETLDQMPENASPRSVNIYTCKQHAAKHLPYGTNQPLVYLKPLGSNSPSDQSDSSLVISSETDVPGDTQSDDTGSASRGRQNGEGVCGLKGITPIASTCKSTSRSKSRRLSCKNSYNELVCDRDSTSRGQKMDSLQGATNEIPARAKKQFSRSKNSCNELVCDRDSTSRGQKMDSLQGATNKIPARVKKQFSPRYSRRSSPRLRKDPSLGTTEETLVSLQDTSVSENFTLGPPQVTRVVKMGPVSKRVCISPLSPRDFKPIKKHEALKALSAIQDGEQLIESSEKCRKSVSGSQKIIKDFVSLQNPNKYSDNNHDNIELKTDFKLEEIPFSVGAKIDTNSNYSEKTDQCKHKKMDQTKKKQEGKLVSSRYGTDKLISEQNVEHSVCQVASIGHSDVSNSLYVDGNKQTSKRRSGLGGQVNDKCIHASSVASSLDSEKSAVEPAFSCSVEDESSEGLVNSDKVVSNENEKPVPVKAAVLECPVSRDVSLLTADVESTGEKISNSCSKTSPSASRRSPKSSSENSSANTSPVVGATTRSGRVVKMTAAAIESCMSKDKDSFNFLKSKTPTSPCGSTPMISPAKPRPSHSLKMQINFDRPLSPVQTHENKDTGENEETASINESKTDDTLARLIAKVSDRITPGDLELSTEQSFSELSETSTSQSSEQESTCMSVEGDDDTPIDEQIKCSPGNTIERGNDLTTCPSESGSTEENMKSCDNGNSESKPGGEGVDISLGNNRSLLPDNEEPVPQLNLKNKPCTPVPSASSQDTDNTTLGGDEPPSTLMIQARQRLALSLLNSASKPSDFRPNSGQEIKPLMSSSVLDSGKAMHCIEKPDELHVCNSDRSKQQAPSESENVTRTSVDSTDRRSSITSEDGSRLKEVDPRVLEDHVVFEKQEKSRPTAQQKACAFMSSALDDYLAKNKELILEKPAESPPAKFSLQPKPEDDNADVDEVEGFVFMSFSSRESLHTHTGNQKKQKSWSVEPSTSTISDTSNSYNPPSSQQWKTKYLTFEEVIEAGDPSELQQKGKKLHWRTQERLARNLSPNEVYKIGLELKKRRRKNPLYTKRKKTYTGMPRLEHTFLVSDELAVGHSNEYSRKQKPKRAIYGSRSARQFPFNRGIKYQNKTPELVSQSPEKEGEVSLLHASPSNTRNIAVEEYLKRKNTIEDSPRKTVAGGAKQPGKAQRRVDTSDVTQVTISHSRALEAAEAVIFGTTKHPEWKPRPSSPPVYPPSQKSACDKPGCRYGCVCYLCELDYSSLPPLPASLEGVTCDQKFCRLGCVCQSLRKGETKKQHCGVADCMFGCICQRKAPRLSALHATSIMADIVRMESIGDDDSIPLPDEDDRIAEDFEEKKKLWTDTSDQINQPKENGGKRPYRKRGLTGKKTSETGKVPFRRRKKGAGSTPLGSVVIKTEDNDTGSLGTQVSADTGVRTSRRLKDRRGIGGIDMCNSLYYFDAQKWISESEQSIKRKRKDPVVPMCLMPRARDAQKMATKGKDGRVQKQIVHTVHRGMVEKPEEDELERKQTIEDVDLELEDDKEDVDGSSCARTNIYIPARWKQKIKDEQLESDVSQEVIEITPTDDEEILDNGGCGKITVHSSVPPSIAPSASDVVNIETKRNIPLRRESPHPVQILMNTATQEYIPVPLGFGRPALKELIQSGKGIDTPEPCGLEEKAPSPPKILKPMKVQMVLLQKRSAKLDKNSESKAVQMETPDQVPTLLEVNAIVDWEPARSHILSKITAAIECGDSCPGSIDVLGYKVEFLPKSCKPNKIPLHLQDQLKAQEMYAIRILIRYSDGNSMSNSRMDTNENDKELLSPSQKDPPAYEEALSSLNRKQPPAYHKSLRATELKEPQTNTGLKTLLHPNISSVADSPVLPVTSRTDAEDSSKTAVQECCMMSKATGISGLGSLRVQMMGLKSTSTGLAPSQDLSNAGGNTTGKQCSHNDGADTVSKTNLESVSSSPRFTHHVLQGPGSVLHSQTDDLKKTVTSTSCVNSELVISKTSVGETLVSVSSIDGKTSTQNSDQPAGLNGCIEDNKVSQEMAKSDASGGRQSYIRVDKLKVSPTPGSTTPLDGKSGVTTPLIFTPIKVSTSSGQPQIRIPLSALTTFSRPFSNVSISSTVTSVGQGNQVNQSKASAVTSLSASTGSTTSAVLKTADGKSVNAIINLLPPISVNRSLLEGSKRKSGTVTLPYTLTPVEQTVNNVPLSGHETSTSVTHVSLGSGELSIPSTYPVSDACQPVNTVTTSNATITSATDFCTTGVTCNETTATQSCVTPEVFDAVPTMQATDLEKINLTGGLKENNTSTVYLLPDSSGKFKESKLPLTPLPHYTKPGDTLIGLPKVDFGSPPLHVSGSEQPTSSANQSHDHSKGISLHKENVRKQEKDELGKSKYKSISLHFDAEKVQVSMASEDTAGVVDSQIKEKSVEMVVNEAQSKKGRPRKTKNRSLYSDEHGESEPPKKKKKPKKKTIRELEDEKGGSVNSSPPTTCPSASSCTGSTTTAAVSVIKSTCGTTQPNAAAPLMLLSIPIPGAKTPVLGSALPLLVKGPQGNLVPLSENNPVLKTIQGMLPAAVVPKVPPGKGNSSTSKAMSLPSPSSSPSTVAVPVSIALSGINLAPKSVGHLVQLPVPVSQTSSPLQSRMTMSTIQTNSPSVCTTSSKANSILSPFSLNNFTIVSSAVTPIPSTVVQKSPTCHTVPATSPSATSAAYTLPVTPVGSGFLQVHGTNSILVPVTLPYKVPTVQIPTSGTSLIPILPKAGVCTTTSDTVLSSTIASVPSTEPCNVAKMDAETTVSYSCPTAPTNDISQVINQPVSGTCSNTSMPAITSFGLKESTVSALRDPSSCRSTPSPFSLPASDSVSPKRATELFDELDRLVSKVMTGSVGSGDEVMSEEDQSSQELAQENTSFTCENTCERYSEDHDVYKDGSHKPNDELHKKTLCGEAEPVRLIQETGDTVDSSLDMLMCDSNVREGSDQLMEGIFASKTGFTPNISSSQDSIPTCVWEFGENSQKDTAEAGTFDVAPASGTPEHTATYTSNDKDIWSSMKDSNGNLMLDPLHGEIRNTDVNIAKQPLIDIMKETIECDDSENQTVEIAEWTPVVEDSSMSAFPASLAGSESFLKDHDTQISGDVMNRDQCIHLKRADSADSSDVDVGCVQDSIPTSSSFKAGETDSENMNDFDTSDTDCIAGKVQRKGNDEENDVDIMSDEECLPAKKMSAANKLRMYLRKIRAKSLYEIKPKRKQTHQERETVLPHMLEFAEEVVVVEDEDNQGYRNNDQRENHSTKERQRRHDMAYKFDSLRMMLFPQEDVTSKYSKQFILDSAVECIDALKEKELILKTEKASLTRCREILMARKRKLKEAQKNKYAAMTVDEASGTITLTEEGEALNEPSPHIEEYEKSEFDPQLSVKAVDYSNRPQATYATWSKIPTHSDLTKIKSPARTATSHSFVPLKSDHSVIFHDKYDPRPSPTPHSDRTNINSPIRTSTLHPVVPMETDTSVILLDELHPSLDPQIVKNDTPLKTSHFPLETDTSVISLCDLPIMLSSDEEEDIGLVQEILDSSEVLVSQSRYGESSGIKIVDGSVVSLAPFPD